MEVFPYAWLLFLPFIITTAFAVLNLFIGVIVDAMQTEHEAEARGERDAMREDTKAILSEIKALREEVATLKSTKG
jgi:voltage-gated sodium channel